MDLKTIFIFLAVMIGISFFRRMTRKKQLDEQRKLAAEKKPDEDGDPDEDNKSYDDEGKEEHVDNYWDEDGNIIEDSKVETKPSKEVPPRQVIVPGKRPIPKRHQTRLDESAEAKPSPIDSQSIELTADDSFVKSKTPAIELNLKTLRQAVILSEIIGKPVSLRGEESN